MWFVQTSGYIYYKSFDNDDDGIVQKDIRKCSSRPLIFTYYFGWLAMIRFYSNELPKNHLFVSKQNQQQ